MKRICYVLLAAALLLSAAVLPGFAAAEPTMTVGSADAHAGETVTLAVKLEHNPGINTFILSIVYDESRLALTGVEAAAALGGTFMYTERTATVAWQAGNDTTLNGDILYLHFSVLDNAPQGDAAVNITYKPGNICNFDEQDVNFAVVAGKVTVAEMQNTVPGDVNGDGKLNARDARMLLRYIAGLAKESEVNLVAADFNGDGKINARDARAMLRSIAGLE